MGNLASVLNAFRTIEPDTHIVSKPEELNYSDRIVLPGVGAFSAGMRHLNEEGWIEALNRNVMKSGKKFMGICLGYQLIAERGYEGGQTEGLGWIRGEVVRLKSEDDRMRIPHIGWNELKIRKEAESLTGTSDGTTFYFVHSYKFNVEDDSAVSSTCYHGEEFAASVEKDNICGMQFHPEKSQTAGLQLIRNFLGRNGG